MSILTLLYGFTIGKEYHKTVSFRDNQPIQGHWYKGRYLGEGGWTLMMQHLWFFRLFVKIVIPRASFYKLFIIVKGRVEAASKYLIKIYLVKIVFYSFYITSIKRALRGEEGEAFLSFPFV